MIQFSCATCNARYAVDDGLADKVIRCRDCNEWGRVLPTKVSHRLRGDKARVPAGGEWYYRLSGMAVGPVSAEELWQRALDGKMSEDSPVRNGADGSWEPAGQLRWLTIKSSPHIDTSQRVRTDEVPREPTRQLG